MISQKTLLLYILLSSLLASVSTQGLDSLVRIGRLQCTKHNVQGTLYAKDYRTLLVEDFVYDGAAPDAFFYVGVDEGLPSGHGIRIQYPPGSDAPLRKFNKERVEIKLPESVNLAELTWFSVWCRAYSVNFGEILPNNKLRRNC